MQLFHAYFTAIEPIVISDGSSEGMKHSSLSYIPGSMLLGAFANLWKNTHNGKSDGEVEFDAMFTNGEILWGHAIPTCEDRPCLPVPLSWNYVKNKGRLPVFASKLSHHPVIINQLRADEDMSVKDSQADKRKKLPQGFVDIDTFCTPKINFQRSTHIALNSNKRMAKEGQLYSYQAISKGASFCSRIFCTKGQALALKKLLQKDLTIYVGHARSAGYGALQLTNLKEIASKDNASLNHGEHSIFLTSDYYATCSWKNPLDALKDDISKFIKDISWIDKKTFCQYTRLESFNGLWLLPRPTRHGISSGSVLTFTCSKASNIPITMGAWTQEGYGRFLVDPPLLKDMYIEPKVSSFNHKIASSIESEQTWMFMPIWRNRSLERIAKNQAFCVWHNSAPWKEIFKWLKDGKLSQSQRGNIRNMLATLSPKAWIDTFSQMLYKTPGLQWKNTKTYCPFRKRREHLDSIMLKLLDEEICSKMLSEAFPNEWLTPNILGSKLSNKEEKLFNSMRHKRFLLEFLKRWEKELCRKNSPKQSNTIQDF